MPLLSGFAMMRNASKLYYPAVESIRSALPIVDEFVVALGQGDADDDTLERLRALGDPRVRIIPRVWDEQRFSKGAVFADETTFALSQCRSTFCLYLQADEVLHEDDLSNIVETCRAYENDPRVEGLLFDYYHFWGDYDHHLDTHGICRREIRIVRNGIGAFSYLDACSFRRPPNEKLRVVRVPAHIYHYGYVRPPHLMAVKKRVQDSIHRGREVSIADADRTAVGFEYGPLGDVPRFSGSHPRVMREFIERLSWRDQLDYGKRKLFGPVLHKHQKLYCRVLSFLERNFTGRAEIFGWHNHELLHLRGRGGPGTRPSSSPP